ncbi:MAG: hypothetical protein N3A38_06150 [Planctomycetota bacterium]|nr:hypothetical protein [Planctomycetota bacterium]
MPVGETPDGPPASETADGVSAPRGRREFLLLLGRGFGAAFLGGIAARLAAGWSVAAGKDRPADRARWRIDQARCTFCGKCATACVRKPSAVKAVNDQKLCSNCVVCYGHIYNRSAPSDRIEKETRVCPADAVRRWNFSGGQDGYFIYEIRHEDCSGCGACARECNRYGSKSMSLIIRPDICLDCNECAIAAVCPSGAIYRAPRGEVTEARGIPEDELWGGAR